MTGDLRLAELLGALSLVTDLGMGNTPEEAMRACLLATSLSRSAGLDETDVATVYWTTLLRHIGCTASAHEEAAHVGGDEMALRPLASRSDFRSVKDNLALMSATLKNVAPARRPKVMLTSFGPWGNEALKATCEVGSTMAERLGMHRSVGEGLYGVFERWDGKGVPRKLKGDAIPLGARYAQVATLAVAFGAIGGVDLARDVIRARAGGMIDPAVASAFCDRGQLLGEVEGVDALPSIIEAEPEPVRTISADRLDACARAFADMVDLKSPFTHGHSVGVAELAAGAGGRLGLPEQDVDVLRRAGLLHDLGRVAIPDGIWERPGPLSTGDWEQVRLHAYHSERILSCAPVLGPVARAAGLHHERMNGSGYHRQAAGSQIPMSARVLAVADAYDAMTHERAYRPALTHQAASGEFEAAVRERALDADAVTAVLEASGHRTKRLAAELPAGLSRRELEVLRLLASGLSNREIARSLFISPRTAESHVQHIYTKIGFSTRAGAAMFAMHHDLLV
ncbi:MAG: HD domain-containing protein [Actinomycetota bacterium]|nr:HD domain-containing protein [Actinomycetota bacterium]MDH5312651.1 HD domain-containing protein [Actinomycetota bacterium]